MSRLTPEQLSPIPSLGVLGILDLQPTRWFVLVVASGAVLGDDTHADEMNDHSHRS
jgi:hypothetical protein